MKRFLVAGLLVAGAAAGLWTYRQSQRALPPAAAAPEPSDSADWLKRLYSQNPREAEAAAEEVRNLGERALPILQRTLGDEHAEAETLKAALKACVILGQTAAPIVADVAEVLAEPGLTAEAAVALSYMGPDAFEPLSKALTNPDPIVRREALRSLGKLKERASLPTSRVLPLLVQGMKDSHETVRAVAATYLGIIHQGAEQAIPALVAGLSDADVEVRRASAAALAEFDPAQAAPGLPALRKAARDRDRDVAREAGRAIVKLEGR